MKKFAFKLILFISLLFSAITVFLYKGGMVYHTGEYPMWKSKMEYVENIHESENLIIGDSRATVAFVPKIIEGDFYNLAVGGGSPIEGYFFLKRYIEKKKVKTIILSFSPFHLEFSNIFFDMTLRYGFLSKQEINDIFKKSKDLDDKFCDTYNNWKIGKLNGYRNFLDYYYNYLKALLIDFKFFYPYLPEVENSMIEKRFLKNKRIYKEIKLNKGNYLYGNLPEAKGENSEAEKMTEFKCSRTMDYYLNELLTLARNNNIKVYYIMAPFNEDSYKIINEKNSLYIDKYNNYINSLMIKYKNVTWLADIFYYGNEYFGDASHLNVNGQNKFSNYVNECLKEK